MYLLAGDIGGTKTALSLYERGPAGGFREVERSRVPSAHYSGLTPLVRDFLNDACDGRPVPLAAAAFGVAGPVEDGVCRTTNLPWVIHQEQLSVGLETRAGLINDFHAVGLGIDQLADDDLEVLQEGDVDPAGPVAIIGAGTGLGEALVVPGPHGPQVVASEGGHADFAAHNEEEIDLLRYLLRHHSRVSMERVVSGPGLHTLYRFLIETGRESATPQTLAAIEAGDPGREIGVRGLSGEDAACERALRLFVSLYGAEAGNLALKVLPTGGLYVTGGIAPQLLDKLRDGSFMHAFLDKGRMSPLLQRMRVSVVRNADVGLLGARALAETLSQAN